MRHVQQTTTNWKSTVKTCIWITFISITFSVLYIICLIADDATLRKHDKLSYAYFGDMTISSMFGFCGQVIMPFYLCNFITRSKSICLLLFCVACDSTFRIIWFLFRLAIEAQPLIWRQMYLMIWASINDLNALITVPFISYMSYHSQIHIDWILLMMYFITVVWFIGADEIGYIFFDNINYSPYLKLTMLVFLAIVITCKFKYSKSKRNTLYQRVLFNHQNDKYQCLSGSPSDNCEVSFRQSTPHANRGCISARVPAVQETTIMSQGSLEQEIDDTSSNNSNYIVNANILSQLPIKNVSIIDEKIGAEIRQQSSDALESSMHNYESNVNFLCVCCVVVSQELLTEYATLVEVLDYNFDHSVLFSHDITSLIIYTGFIAFYWIEFYVASTLLKKIKVNGIPKYELLFPFIYFNDLLLTLFVSFTDNITWLFYCETMIKIIFKWILWHPRMLYFYDHYLPKPIAPTTNKFRLAIQFFYNIFASVYVFIISLVILWIDFAFSTKSNGTNIGWMLQFDQTLSNVLNVTKNILILFAIEAISFVLLFRVLKSGKEETFPSVDIDSDHLRELPVDSNDSLNVNQSKNGKSTETSISRVDKRLTIDNAKMYVVNSLNEETVYFTCTVTLVSLLCVFFKLDNSTLWFDKFV